MTWAERVRLWFDQLFFSSYTRHLENEISVLRNEVAQSHIDNAKLQLMLNSVTPAGLMMARREHPPAKPEPATPAITRWASVVAERQKEIDADRIRKMSETQKSKEQVA